MKNLLAVCVLGAAFAAAGVAHADTFQATFGGDFIFSNGASIAFSSGPDVTFTTSGVPTPGTFLNPNTYAISNLQGTVIINGVDYTIGSLENGLGGANKLADNFLGFLSPDGFDFAVSTTTSTDPVFSQLLIDYNAAAGTWTGEACGFSGCETATDGTVSGFDIYDVTNAPAATPEPGSLALLGTSILGGAGILRRRFRVRA